MKLYAKNENGVWVTATPEQIADPTIEKLQVDEAPSESDDNVKRLESMIADLASHLKGMDKIQEKLEAMKAWESRMGFPVPNEPPAPKGTEEYSNWNLAAQGKALQDRLLHPTHQISEDHRQLLAKWWMYVIQAGVMGDVKAKEKFISEFGRVEKTPIGDAGNSFPLPDILESEVLAYARESSVILQEATQFPMASNKQSFPRETASATVSWGNTTGESEPAIEEVEIDAYEYSCFSVVKNTTLRDATSDIVSWLTLNLSESAGLGLDDVAFNSSGAEMPYCSGLLTAACGYSVVMGSTKTSFADLSQKDLSEMIGKLDGVRKGGAKYYMHGSIIHYVRTLEDENRRPIFNNGLVGVPSIFGYPYTEVIKMPSTDGADTAFILFGNLKNFFIGRIVNSTTLDVNPWEYWTTNRTAFKLYQRWGMKIALPKAFVRLLTASA